MIQINLKDNQYDGRPLTGCINDNIKLSQDCQNKLMSDLQFIEHKQVKELLKDGGKDLFILANEDKIEDEYVFSLTDTTFDTCRIQTGNIVGFIGYGDTQLNISSRFSTSQKETPNAETPQPETPKTSQPETPKTPQPETPETPETSTEEDLFLHYMLSKVFNINLSELEHEQKKSNIFDFIIFLFPYYLQKAFSKGIFRQYIKNDYNDANVKGPINVAQFIKKDNPFQGKIAYSKREYSVDNNLTELVRHTIEYIKAGKYKSILQDKNTRSYAKEIIAATKNYNKNQRNQIISKNSKPIRHPYYTEWTNLQKLCLMILNHHKLKYATNNSHKIYGILIDISWLWEEYLNTILSNAAISGLIHPRNRTGKGRVHLFSDHTCSRYPDFYSTHHIFDAKYKRFESFKSVSDIGRDDLNQMVTYIHILSTSDMHPLKDGYFLYPSKNKLTFEPKDIYGLGGKIGAIGLKISAATTYASFAKEMKANEAMFTQNFVNLEKAPTH